MAMTSDKEWMRVPVLRENMDLADVVYMKETRPWKPGNPAFHGDPYLVMDDGISRVPVVKVDDNTFKVIETNEILRKYVHGQD